MSCVFLALSCCLVAVKAATTIEKTDPYFRSDYEYLDSQAAFYKIHKTPKKWTDAHALCQYEGATLIVPESKVDAQIVKEIMDDNLSNNSIPVYIGVNDIIMEGAFVTSTGNEHGLWHIFENWDPDRLDEDGTQSDCVVMWPNMSYVDVDCDKKFPFVCKKTLASLIINKICQTYDTDYFPDAASSRCYKLHLAAKKWAEAFKVCQAEQGYLAIIDSAEEAELLKDKLAKYPANTIKGAFRKGEVFMGFHDKFVEGEFVTVLGQPLDQTSFSEWASSPYLNTKGQDCGSFHRHGFYNDLDCTVKRMFFCERELDDISIGLYTKHPDNSTVLNLNLQDNSTGSNSKLQDKLRVSDEVILK